MKIGNIVIAQRRDYKTEIAEIIRSPITPQLMLGRILDYHEHDIADALELLDKDERRRLYSLLDTEILSDVLEYSDNLYEYISELDLNKKVEVLNRFEVTTAVDYLRNLDISQRNMLIDLIENIPKEEIELLSSFREEEIGSKMTTNYVSIHTGISIRQAMKELVEQAADNDNISTIYVVDEDETLLGAIDLKDLIIAREGTTLESIIMISYPYVYGNELIEDCIEDIKDYSEDSIPVLNESKKLIGVLTAQDITEVVDDELGDDYAKLAGLSSEEDLKEPLKKSVRKRLPWLVILLALGLIVSSVVGIFEEVISNLALIVSFQSLVLDMAGNVGTQSLAITIRVLMDEQLSGKQKFLLIAKEARVGLFNGGIIGILSFVIIGLYLFLLKGESAMLSFSVSFCTGIALLFSIFISSIAGTAIPMIFKRLKIDPAVASGPLITTINDLVAVVTYYGLAWILLINILKL